MSHEEGGDKPREGYDQAALDEASRQLHMFFLREGSRYGTVACEEIGRVFMTAYLNASRSSVATNEWQRLIELAREEGVLAGKLEAARSARLPKDAEELLRWLDRKGGLGLDVHERIAAVLREYVPEGS